MAIFIAASNAIRSATDRPKSYGPWMCRRCDHSELDHDHGGFLFGRRRCDHTGCSCRRFKGATT